MGWLDDLINLEKLGFMSKCHSHLHLERRDQSGTHYHCPQVDSESEATNMRMILEWCQRVQWQGCSMLFLQCYSTPSQTRGSQGTWSKHQPKSSEPTDVSSPSIREDHVKAFFHNFKPFQPPGIVDQNQNMKHVKHLIHWSRFKLQVWCQSDCTCRKRMCICTLYIRLYIYLYNNVHILYSWYIHCVQTESWRIWLLFSEVLLQNQSVRKSFVKRQMFVTSIGDPSPEKTRLFFAVWVFLLRKEQSGSSEWMIQYSIFLKSHEWWLLPEDSSTISSTHHLPGLKNIFHVAS